MADFVGLVLRERLFREEGRSVVVLLRSLQDWNGVGVPLFEDRGIVI